MSGWIVVGGLLVLLVGWYVLGAVFRVIMKDTAKPTISSNYLWGCSAVIIIGTFLTVLYALVRFVKWAWE